MFSRPDPLSVVIGASFSIDQTVSPLEVAIAIASSERKAKSRHQLPIGETAARAGDDRSSGTVSMKKEPSSDRCARCFPEGENFSALKLSEGPVRKRKSSTSTYGLGGREPSRSLKSVVVPPISVLMANNSSPGATATS